MAATPAAPKPAAATTAAALLEDSGCDEASASSSDDDASVVSLAESDFDPESDSELDPELVGLASPPLTARLAASDTSSSTVPGIIIVFAPASEHNE